MKKKIAIIGTVGLPAKYGGFESFVEQVVQRLWDDFEITVYCQKNAYQTHPKKINKVFLKYIPLKANGVQSIPYDVLSIFDALRYADVLLILGVSGCILIPIIRFFGCKKNIVVNIDGIEWKRNKWSGFAKWFLHFSEKCAVRYADSVVGDNQVIVDYVENAYHKPCKLIEYGADNQKLEIK